MAVLPPRLAVLLHAEPVANTAFGQALVFAAPAEVPLAMLPACCDTALQLWRCDHSAAHDPSARWRAGVSDGRPLRSPEAADPWRISGGRCGRAQWTPRSISAPTAGTGTARRSSTAAASRRRNPATESSLICS